MKKTILILALCLLVSQLKAQKIIEKSFDLNGRYVEMKVPFASLITVKTWDKPTVYFKAVIDIENDLYVDLYQLDVMQRKGAITIASETDKLFDAFGEEWKKIKEERKKDPEARKSKKHYYYGGIEYEFNYTLYVPKEAQFKISSINGDMMAEQIEGDFTADLINGNIEIQRYRGNLDLSTINGEIDLKVNNTRLVAETVHGNIYADGKLALTSSDQHVGQKVMGGSKNAETQLTLNTVNGNMYLRM